MSESVRDSSNSTIIRRAVPLPPSLPSFLSSSSAPIISDTRKDEGGCGREEEEEGEGNGHQISSHTPAGSGRIVRGFVICSAAEANGISLF